MPRRVSASQMRSIIRQAQTKQRQAVQRYNSDVRRHNSEQKQKTDAYNRAIRSYNNRLRSNHSRLQSALQRLARQPVSAEFTSLRQSSLLLSTAYERLDNGGADPFLSDIAERETANSVSVLNVLLGDEKHSPGSVDGLATSRITDSVFLKTWRCVGLAQSLLSILQTQMLPDIFAQAPGRLSRKSSIWRLQTRTYLLGSPIAKSRNGVESHRRSWIKRDHRVILTNERIGATMVSSSSCAIGQRTQTWTS